MRASVFAFLLGSVSKGLAAPKISPLEARQEVNRPIYAPFRGYDDCSEEQEKAIRSAWSDVVKIIESIGMRDWQKGTLEKRFFGQDIGKRLDHAKFVDNVYERIRQLNDAPGGPVSEEFGIRISCKDLPQKHKSAEDQLTCAKVINEGSQGAVGGYTFTDFENGGDGTKTQDGVIVLCNIFFLDGQQFIEYGADGGVIADIERNGLAAGNGNILGKGTLLLHEMTHLGSIGGVTSDKSLRITDQLLGDSVVKAYGAKQCERLANFRSSVGEDGQTRRKAHLNADSLTWFAAEKWYKSVFGKEPPGMITPRDDGSGGGEEEESPSGPTKAVTIILEEHNNPRKGQRSYKWLFYSTAFGETSTCKKGSVPAAEKEVYMDHGIDDQRHEHPGGEFKMITQDGECTYKNDGGENAGALWCGEKGDEGHTCRWHDQWQQVEECDFGLDPASSAFIKQKAAVVCEW